MKRSISLSRSLVLAACTVLAVCVFAGCPWFGGKTTVTTLFTGAALKADVPAGDIESLTLTVTEISVDRGGDANTDDPDSPSKVVVFSGEMEVNVKDLTGVSEVMSSAEIPAGTYTKIRMKISNPRLVLTADPETEITDIHLTANARLFVSEQFELPAGQNNLLILSFGGLHLVLQGNGSYTLTPQLDVTIDVESADVSLSGNVTAVYPETGEITVALDEGASQVICGDAPVYLPEDTDVPMGAFEDLVVGATVEVTGTIAIDGTVTADTIRIVTLPAS